MGLNIFSINASTRITCQVCHTICIYPYSHFLMTLKVKVASDLQFVGSDTPDSSTTELLTPFYYLPPRSLLTWPSPPLPCWWCFACKYSSEVAFAKLMEAIRIAIWDRKKIIVAFATGVWGVNIAFLIQGKSLPPYIGVIKILLKCGVVSGVIRVNTHPHHLLKPTEFIDRSSALRGSQPTS